ncbi:MAG: hypothetical protein O7G87_19130, partial [bacterium]|nr:hypothetical protein [bacterium]
MRKNSLPVLLVFVFLTSAEGQITVSSLTEMQRGEVPGADSTAISNVYEQFDIDFSQKGLQAGVRAEVYNVWGTDRRVTKITQKFAR